MTIAVCADEPFQLWHRDTLKRLAGMGEIVGIVFLKGSKPAYHAQRLYAWLRKWDKKTPIQHGAMQLAEPIDYPCFTGWMSFQCDEFHLPLEEKLHDVDILVWLSQQAPPEKIGISYKYILQFAVVHSNSWNQLDNFDDIIEKRFSTQLCIRAYVQGSQKYAQLMHWSTRTDVHSVWRNQNAYCWQAGRMMERALKKLASDMWSCGTLEWRNAEYVRDCNAFTMLWNIGKPLRNRIAYKLSGMLQRKRWGVIYGQCSSLSSGFIEKGRIRPGARKIWADPFIWIDQGEPYIFAEHQESNGNGIIEVARIDENGRIMQPQVALVEPFHLSFPYIFQDEAKLYMLPETLYARQIRLYECEAFPNRWRLSRVLMDEVYASDSVLFRHDGRWWLFSNIIDHLGEPTDDMLYLFYADDLTQPFVPHPMNPLVCDTDHARMGGGVFMKDGCLIRPAQDCSGSYGRGISFYEITRLDTQNYEERLVALGKDVHPQELQHVHTFTCHGDYAAIDAMV